MKTYYLVTESGPRHMKTYVSVPNLLGCNMRGATTDEALASAPDAIREYLRFLKRHGEDVDPDADFETEVLQEIITSTFAGNGTSNLEADLEPLTAAEAEQYICRLEWIAEELIDAVRDLENDTLTSDGPEDSKRPIRKIMQHMIGSERGYLSSRLGSVKGMSAIADEADRGEGDPIDQYTRLRALLIPRLRAMTDEERTEPKITEKNVITARRMMRRLLEHGWEHLSEIQRRVTR